MNYVKQAQQNRTNGRAGEEAVVLALERHGFRVLGRNMHTRYGEIDVLAVRARVVHVVEVKTRSSDAFGGPESALTKMKLLKMRRAAFQILAEQFPKLRGRLQFDLAAVRMASQQRILSIQWFWNIGNLDFE